MNRAFRGCSLLIFVCFLCLSHCVAQAKVLHTTDQHSEFDGLVFSGNSLESGSGEAETLTRMSPDCMAEYQYEADHTMCMADDLRVIKSGISPAEREQIVDFHNKVRATVQPPATDLTKLIWDESIAAVAAKWAKQCIVDHDKNRNIPAYGMFIGQNVAAGYRKWEEAMKSWFNEVELYHYGQDAEDYLGPGGWRSIGHYTQLVQNTTSRLGCGFAECTETPYGRYYVCNYARGQASTEYPYTSGKQCSGCPDFCQKGLCDCGGHLCLNGGQLDIQTCSCKCQQIYRGDDCSVLNCPESDAIYCGTHLTVRDCEVYANVPVLCPFMCGLCGFRPSESKGRMTAASALNIVVSHVPTTTPEPVYVSPDNCTYVGTRSSLEECKKYGDRGSDSQFCQSQGGQFTCSDCTHFYNVKRDYCPVMCGLCDAPCGGKKCMNNGRLDTDTCKCKCVSPFSGDGCEILNCPKTDKWHCQFFHVSFCSTYVNVPVDCPFLCGICAKTIYQR